MGRRESLITHLTMSFVGLCRAGDLEGVKAALQRGADVNTKSDYGLTGLMHAVRHNCNSVVALLLKTPNIDVNQRDDYRRCALHRAVLADNIEALKLLLNVPNIDVNIVDSYGENAEHRSAIKDNIWALKMLLNHPGLTALTLNQKNWRGDTPVMLALKRKKFDHLALLAAVPRVDFDAWSLELQAPEERAALVKVLKEATEIRLIIEQKRQVSKVLLDGLYDPDCPLSMLRGVRTEIIGEIVWKEMLVKNWEIYSGKRIAFWKKKVPRCWPFGRSSPVNKKKRRKT